MNNQNGGPHHSDDTEGDNVILVEFKAVMLPHDSPEFQERAKRPWKPHGGRVQATSVDQPPAAE